MELKRYFEVKAVRYVPNSNVVVYRPASLNYPKDNAVMFIMEEYLEKSDVFLKCKNCLIFWPGTVPVPEEITKRHAVCLVESPHNAYCRFFADNGITYLPQIEEVDNVNGALIAKTAILGKDCRIFPGAYIGGQVTVGNNVYIGSGVKLIGEVHIGNNVVIRENTVIGADGLSTDRDVDGRALTMPQFGGVYIEDDVQIGALTVIARGAIDQTRIKRGSKIDNSCFISHNVIIGEDTFIVGETIMFGSSSVGNQTLISGNSAIRDGRHVGNHAKVGMGAVVTRNVADESIVKGNPAR